MPVFLLPVVLLISALYPFAVLSMPPVFVQSALVPVAVFPSPVLLESASKPVAVL